MDNNANLYDKIATYIAFGDYSPLIEVISIFILILLFYLLIFRPIVNHFLTINYKDKNIKNIIIKDAKYTGEKELQKIREEMWKKENKNFEELVKNDINNFIKKINNTINKTFTFILKLIKKERNNQNKRGLNNAHKENKVKKD